MKRTIQIVFVTVISLGLISCGTPGAPQPPSLEIPKQITDLKASRKGDRITLVWTQPTKTTDGMNIRRAGKTKVCRGDDACMEVNVDHAIGTFTETVEAARAGKSLETAQYTVITENAHGRSAGLSNTVTALLSLIDFKLSELKAETQGDGVHITFNALNLPLKPSPYTIELKILRAEKGKEIFTPVNRTMNTDREPTAQGSARWEMVDDTIEWEITYHYKAVGIVTVLNKADVLGRFETEDSATVEAFAHDVVPPAEPGTVQAVANAIGSERSVDITWSPNSESDLAGYNVYRREPEFSAKPEKINIELLRGTAFKDTTAKAGHRYSYTITAVDIRNNESKPSQPAEENVPK